MLSRTASDLYWMSRYLERAENLARMLDVSYSLSLMPHDGGAVYNLARALGLQGADLRKARAQLVFDRADAAHHLRAGQVQFQKLVHLLFHRQPADVEEHRRCAALQPRAVGRKGFEVDAARPQPRLGEAARTQVVHDGGRGRQRG